MGLESILSGITGISDGGNNTAAELRDVLSEMTVTLSADTYETTEHIANNVIHFEQSAITITEEQISDLKPYLTGYTETDTLNSVTTRGNITPNNIQVGAMSANTYQINNSGDTSGAGLLSWSNDWGTAELKMKGGNVTLQLGQENYMYIRADEDLADGDIVYYTGVHPEFNIMKVSKFIANDSILELLVIGVATEPILANRYGFVTTFGMINNVDTTGLNGETWSQGSILYASDTIAGALTNVEPESPSLKISMAIVMRSHATLGSIMVRPTIGNHIHDLHGVNISSETDGDILQYSGGTWGNVPLPSSAPVLKETTGSTYTFILEDANTTVTVDNGAGAGSVVIDAAVAFPIGTEIRVINVADASTLSGTGGTLLRTALVDLEMVINESLKAIKISATDWVVIQ